MSPGTATDRSARARVDGGSGDDKVRLGSGNDSVVGGSGHDGISAGAGEDTIDASDGERDVAKCGQGTDSVKADGHDVLEDCENVTH